MGLEAADLFDQHLDDVEVGHRDRGPGDRFGPGGSLGGSLEVFEQLGDWTLVVVAGGAEPVPETLLGEPPQIVLGAEPAQELPGDVAQAPMIGPAVMRVGVGVGWSRPGRTLLG